MWHIKSRSTASPLIGKNNIVPRLKSAEPETYNGACATYHLAPNEEIELHMEDQIAYAAQTGDEYPRWGLGRGNANAVYLDQHVESMPYGVDTHQYAWPIRN